MPDFYSQFHLNKKASSKKLFRKLEKIVRQEIQEDKDPSLALKAFVILSHPNFKKYYDKTLAIPQRFPKLKRSLEVTATNYAEKVKRESCLANFSEKKFLKNNGQQIFLSTFGLDFILQGVGNKEPSFNIFENQTFKNGQAAFLVSNLFFFLAYPFL